MIVGVDMSTRFIDLVKLPFDNDQAQWRRVDIQHKRGSFHAARHVRHQMGQQALCGGWWDDVAAAWLEDPMSRNAGTTKALALVTGALIANVPAHVQVERTKPNEWQRVFLGAVSRQTPVRPTKFLVGAHASRLLREAGVNHNHWPQDALEAFAIAYAARELMSRAAEAA